MKYDIRLKRAQKKQYRSNVLLKGQTKVEYEYEIEIRSLKTKDSALTLKDQVPVSDDKTIAVEISQISGGKFNEEIGEVVWDFELPANETKTITLSYSVAWSKDKQLNLYVHLSADVETALKVGRKHGKPFIFEVDCRQMSADGYRFFRSANGVWLIKEVPARYFKEYKEEKFL